MAVSRVNLCLRPTLANPGTAYNAQWFLVTNNWARATGLTGLPATTGVAGSSSGTVYTAAGPAVAGRTYVGSCSVKAVSGTASGTSRLEWIDANGVSISLTATTAYSQGSGGVSRMTTGVYTAPAGTAAVRMVIAVNANSQQLTGCLLENVASTGGTYFDGTTGGASWAGVAGDSMSQVGTATAAATPTVLYDDRSGRVRVLATGEPALAPHMRVRVRAATTTSYTTVRGGTVALSSGTSVRSADDYEFDTRGGLVYRIEGVTSGYWVPLSLAGRTPVEPVQHDAVEVYFTPPLQRAWLKFVAAPQYNRKVTLTGWGDIARPSRNAIYEVRTRPEPVVVTSPHSSRRVTIELRTFVQDETDALDESLRQGIPLFLHLPETTPLPTMYAVVGDYKRTKPSARSQGAIWSLPLTEVSAPPLSVFGTGGTWASLLAGTATWGALVTAGNTWAAVSS